MNQCVVNECNELEVAYYRKHYCGQCHRFICTSHFTIFQQIENYRILYDKYQQSAHYKLIYKINSCHLHMSTFTPKQYFQVKLQKLINKNKIFSDDSNDFGDTFNDYFGFNPEQPDETCLIPDDLNYDSDYDSEYDFIFLGKSRKKIFLEYNGLLDKLDKLFIVKTETDKYNHTLIQYLKKKFPNDIVGLILLF